MDYEEIPRYRKKAVSKPHPKADHKHIYEPCVFQYYNDHYDFVDNIGFVGGQDECAGSRCTICGHLKRGFPGDNPLKFTKNGLLKPIYPPEFPRIPIDDITKINKK